MKKLMHILKGWSKRMGFISVSTAEEKMAELRLAICKDCPESEEKKILKILNGHADYERSLACTICHCPCWEKSIIVDEFCPLKKW